MKKIISFILALVILIGITPTYAYAADSVVEKLYDENLKPIKNGTYIIATKLNENYVLDIEGAGTSDGDNLQLWERNYTPAQTFKVTHLGNGYYRIVNKNSRKAIDAEWGGIDPGTNVWQYSVNDTPAQIWKITPAGNDNYYIINKESGLYLDVDNAYADSGTNIKLFDKNDAYDAQKWCFIEFDEEKQRRANSYISMGFDSWPVSLYEDDVYHLEGNISSDFNITSVEAIVLNNNGDVVISSYDTPNSLEVDITANSYCNLPFEQLAPGTYQLVVTAKNEADKQDSISDNFTIVELPAESTLDINFTKYPDTITQGNSFGLRGSITSNYNIEHVYGYILNSNGDVVLSSHDTPNIKSVDIRSINLNNSLKFGKLSVGSYVLRTVAEDVMMRVTLDIDFEVIKKNQTANKINTSNNTSNNSCLIDGKYTIEEWNELFGHIIYSGNFQPTYMDVKTKDATVHVSALDASAVVGYPSKGTTLAVIGKCTNKYNHVWYLVEYNGKVCYIYSGDLKTSQTKKNEKPNVADIILNGTSDVLTVVSLIPAVDTFANLLQVPVDILRDDWASAGLSLAGAVPFIGEAADATKTVKLVDKSADAIKAAKNLDKATNTVEIVYKNLDEGVNFTKTTIERMSNSSRHVPVEMLINAIKYGKPMADPQGTRAIMYTTEMIKNGKTYTLEVLYDKASNTILHFLYK